MSNHAWSLGTKYGIVYLENRKLIDEVLKLEGNQLSIDKAVMATYYSPKGKPFAWQLIFNMASWDRVSEVLGIESYEKRPVAPAVRKSSPASSAKSRKSTKSKTPRIKN